MISSFQKYKNYKRRRIHTVTSNVQLAYYIASSIIFNLMLYDDLIRINQVLHFEMKTFLNEHKLDTSGKKEELLERISNHV